MNDHIGGLYGRSQNCCFDVLHELQDLATVDSILLRELPSTEDIDSVSIQHFCTFLLP